MCQFNNPNCVSAECYRYTHTSMFFAALYRFGAVCVFNGCTFRYKLRQRCARLALTRGWLRTGFFLWPTVWNCCEIVATMWRDVSDAWQVKLPLRKRKMFDWLAASAGSSLLWLTIKTSNYVTQNDEKKYREACFANKTLGKRSSIKAQFRYANYT